MLNRKPQNFIDLWQDSPAVMDALFEWWQGGGYGHFVVHMLDGHISHAENSKTIKEENLHKPR